jgi:hypothetical protein
VIELTGRISKGVLMTVLLACWAWLSAAANSGDAIQAGEPSMDPPTLACLGVHWPYEGDGNQNAVVGVRFRRADAPESDWKEALALFRIRPENLFQDESTPKDVVRAFAGSIFDLTPDTEYQIELSLTDPDGGSTTRSLRSRTRPVPSVPKDLRRVQATPDTLARAIKAAQPGDLLLLEKGVYRGCFILQKKATADRPIVVRGVSAEEVILEGGPEDPAAVDVSGSEFVFLESLTFRNCDTAVRANGGTGISFRRCRTLGVPHPFRSRPSDLPSRDFYIADNVLEGPCTWPASPHIIEEEEGIELVGTGHVVCHNRITGFGDAISIYRNPAVSIDITDNDIDVATDDGIELDFGVRNIRCLRNRIANARTGISLQPVYGGPCYVARNEITNTELTPFKLHCSPSGAVIFHNTSVRAGIPFVVSAKDEVRDTILRNNLFLGNDDRFLHWTSGALNCDLDYNGYGPGKGSSKFAGQYYEAHRHLVRNGIEVHGRLLEPPFFSVDLRFPGKFSDRVKAAAVDLHPASTAIDGGVPLPNVNDGYGGAAPDLGARESGAQKPHFGPRAEDPNE